MLYSMVIGYAVFYFTRKNLAIVNPLIREDLDISATSMGLILTLHSIVYGLSKFLSGVIADRSNARYFMAIGLLLSAVMNIFFGLGSSLIFLGAWWILNGLFQGTGVPPCSRLLTLWFSNRESGTAWGIWNSSHQIGGALISVLAGFLASSYGWRSSFYVPAAIAIAVALFLINRLRDHPGSLGLPTIEEYKHEEYKDSPKKNDQKLESTKEIFMRYIVNNPVIWVVCFANFFVYIVRIGFFDWGTTYLNEVGVAVDTGGVIIGVFEITGLVGAFAAGYFSDRFMKGHRGPMAILFMALLTICLLVFWLMPSSNVIYLGTMFGIVGLLVYGPQMLVAVVAAQSAAPQASATAVGLTGLFGYIGSALCSIITGIIIDHHNINGVIAFYLLAAMLGTLLFYISIRWERKSKYSFNYNT